MKNVKDIILTKTFRKRENWKKVRYILKNTNLSIDYIVGAAISARLNDYHNFGHQIGATEMLIKIAIAEGLSREEITQMAGAMLYHDASHRGIVQTFDEMRSFEAMEVNVDVNDYAKFSTVPFNQFMNESRDLIIATTFSLRGKINTLKERIVQDADLAHLGQGPEYWPWASMGLVDEFNRQQATNRSPVEFVKHDQVKFIQFLEKLGGGHVYLTAGARKIFRNPAEDVRIVSAYNEKQIWFAYDARKDDITLAEFKTKLKELA